MHRLGFFILLAGLLFVCASCATTIETVGDSYGYVWDTWDQGVFIKQRETQLSGLDDANFEKLASILAVVDSPLDSLVQFVADQDHSPDETWTTLLFNKYPWVDSIFIADAQGTVTESYPSDLIKKEEISVNIKSKNRKPFIQIEANPVGQESRLYVGTPIYGNADFQGAVVVSFNPQVLFTLYSDPKELIISQPGGGTWTPREDFDTNAFSALPWREMLADSVCGEVQVDGVSYTWLVRYVGTTPYLYATPSVAPE